MSNLETIFFWLATLALAGSFFLALLALFFGKTGPQRLAAFLFNGALVPLLGLGINRWIRTGHPPFVSLFESMIFSVLLLVLIFTIFRWRRPGAGVALAPVAGIALLLMGWSLTVPHQASPLSAALDSVWLFIHASFATAGAAVFLTAFLLLGFILWGTMIASGAIWAHVAWGRYWGWDPIETWSLISWILYALLLHARITFRLSARLFSVLTIITAGVVAFSLWGIQYVYNTIHSYG
jgi:ABC-type transport system involved in cytochrome c biogenesis permease subunit